jgi:glutamyl-Q tRNA(Asp) synthetase
MPASTTTYRGRFAPSPTGPLHFGSLVAAVAGYLDARAHGGLWLLRIEDLDTSRNRPGAVDAILRTLENAALHWYGPVTHQSARIEHYEAALTQIRGAGLLYPCTCSRREIADSMVGMPVSGEARYSGACRGRASDNEFPRPPAWRIRTTPDKIAFDDRLHGRFETADFESTTGDFILRRADGVIAYQLAVVVDDAAFGITDVVRGADLLGSTFRQIFLQRTLGLPTPAYLHVPTATNARGEKLSKQTLAAPVDSGNPGPALWLALRFLGQQPSPDMRRAPPQDLLAWAVAHWRPSSIPCVQSASCENLESLN